MFKRQSRRIAYPAASTVTHQSIKNVLLERYKAWLTDSLYAVPDSKATYVEHWGMLTQSLPIPSYTSPLVILYWQSAKYFYKFHIMPSSIQPPSKRRGNAADNGESRRDQSEELSEVASLVEKRRMQNRISQRNYRMSRAYNSPQYIV